MTPAKRQELEDIILNMVSAIDVAVDFTLDLDIDIDPHPVSLTCCIFSSSSETRPAFTYSSRYVARHPLCSLLYYMTFGFMCDVVLAVAG